MHGGCGTQGPADRRACQAPGACCRLHLHGGAAQTACLGRLRDTLPSLPQQKQEKMPDRSSLLEVEKRVGSSLCPLSLASPSCCVCWWKKRISGRGTAFHSQLGHKFFLSDVDGSSLLVLGLHQTVSPSTCPVWGQPCSYVHTQYTTRVYCMDAHNTPHAHSTPHTCILHTYTQHTCTHTAPYTYTCTLHHIHQTQALSSHPWCRREPSRALAGGAHDDT